MCTIRSGQWGQHPQSGGERFVGNTQEGVSRLYTAQVCDVNKCLLSVSKVVGAGNKVVFDSEGSYIEDKTTGEWMTLSDQHGMYMLKVWTKRGF